MKNKMLVVIAGLLAALLVVGVVGASGVFAQSSTAAHGGPGNGRGFRLGTAELEAAAQALNMTTDQLTAALQGGKTLEQIATDQGVDFADVQEAIQTAHASELRDRIQQAVEDGTITQENADWLLEGLDKGFIGVPGAFGLGGPHGGHGFGPGSGQNPPAQPQPTQPSQQNTPGG
jgi:hypothetical protein